MIKQEFFWNEYKTTNCLNQPCTPYRAKWGLVVWQGEIKGEKYVVYFYDIEGNIGFNRHYALKSDLFEIKD